MPERALTVKSDWQQKGRKWRKGRKGHISCFARITRLPNYNFAFCCRMQNSWTRKVRGTAVIPMLSSECNVSIKVDNIRGQLGPGSKVDQGEHINVKRFMAKMCVPFEQRPLPGFSLVSFRSFFFFFCFCADLHNFQCHIHFRWLAAVSVFCKCCKSSRKTCRKNISISQNKAEAMWMWMRMRMKMKLQGPKTSRRRQDFHGFGGAWG